MALTKLTSWTREKWRAAREWSAPRAVRLGAAVGRAPWRRIGLWTGGIVGGLVATLLLLVTFADWNALKGPISRYVSNATGRAIIIGGDLDVNPWSWTPEIHVTELKVGNPPRFADRGIFADLGEARASVQLLPLLIGRLEIVRIDLEDTEVQLYRSAEGDANWARDPDTATSGRQFNLPAIRQFSSASMRRSCCAAVCVRRVWAWISRKRRMTAASRQRSARWLRQSPACCRSSISDSLKTPIVAPC